MSVSLVVQRACEHDAPQDALLQSWADIALRDHPAVGELVIRIVDEAESQALNAQYRDKDKPTNVLSFTAEPLPEEFAELADEQTLGDLVICAAVVAAEAQAQGKSLQAHWAHMVIHGCLHLLGHDHVEADEAERMEDLERKLLAELNFSDPYE